MIMGIALLAMALLGWGNGPGDKQFFYLVFQAQQTGELEQGSRQAIIETGFSEAYFDKHFRISATFDRPGDTRVVWRFSLNRYEVVVTDAIGFYIQSQKRVYVHSVKNTLGATRDISRTISKARAEALMKACLGRYADEAAVLLRLSPAEKTSLYLTAHSIIRTGPRARSREKSGRTEDKHPEIDQPESEVTKPRGPIRIGYINLETGKCTTGLARATP
jgi:hypothetical protein